jgi:hypothetical protein
MTALSDLTAYQQDRNLSADDLKTIVDVDNDQAMCNLDVQALICEVANSAGTGGGGSGLASARNSADFGGGAESTSSSTASLPRDSVRLMVAATLPTPSSAGQVFAQALALKSDSVIVHSVLSSVASIDSSTSMGERGHATFPETLPAWTSTAEFMRSGTQNRSQLPSAVPGDKATLTISPPGLMIAADDYFESHEYRSWWDPGEIKIVKNPWKELATDDGDFHVLNV